MGELVNDTQTSFGDWITTGEAAEILGVTQRWIQRLVKEGKLRGQKISPKQLLIYRPSVEEYQKSQQ